MNTVQLCNQNNEFIEEAIFTSQFKVMTGRDKVQSTTATATKKQNITNKHKQKTAVPFF